MKWLKKIRESFIAKLKEIMKLLKSIQRPKWLTKQIVRKFSLLLAPFTLYLLVKNPLVLVGGYFPLLFDIEEKKGLRFIMALGANILLRALTITVGIVFFFVGMNYGPHNVLIGSVYIILALLSGFKIPYTFIGILYMNALGYFAFDANYPWFATGFLIFLLLEFLFETKLQLIPFSKRTFGLEYAQLGMKKACGLICLVSLTVVLAVNFVHLISPFNESYAQEAKKYEQIEQRKEKTDRLLELLEKAIEDSNSKIKN